MKIEKEHEKRVLRGVKIIVIALLLFVAAPVFAQTDKLPVFRVKEPVVDYTAVEYEDMTSGCSWYCGAPPITVSASSFLHNQGKNSYRANNAHDFNPSTAWVEGKPDYGIGEYLEFKFNVPADASAGLAVNGLTIVNGYKKSRQVWAENSRVKRLKMYVNSKPFGYVELLDEYGFQRVEFPAIRLPKRQTVNVRFEIADVYKGSKFSDVAISHIEFEGSGVH